MQTSFAEKHFKAEESVTLQNIFSSVADFRDVVSVLPAARLIKASRIFVALQKANRPWEIKKSFLDFDCHRSRFRNIKKAAACELIGAKKGVILSLIYFFKSFWYITVRIIMSFRKPCHMPFRKLVRHFTLTFPPPASAPWQGYEFACTSEG